MEDQQDSSKPEKAPNIFDKDAFRVPSSDMIRYMDAHFDSTACPQCGKDQGWTMDGEGPAADGVEVMRIYRLAYALPGSTFRPLFVMSCQACGAVRQILSDNVVSWLQQNPVESI